MERQRHGGGTLLSIGGHDVHIGSQLLEAFEQSLDPLRIESIVVGQEDKRSFFVHQVRIMIRSILKGLMAFKAWGWWAGMMMSSPGLIVYGVPEMRISASPSTPKIVASKGDLCSLRPWP